MSGGRSVEAELVALDILHHDAGLFPVAGGKQAHPRGPEFDEARAFGLQRSEAISAFQSGSDPDIEVHPVLDGLALGDALEKQPRPDPVGVHAGERGILLVGGKRAVELVPVRKARGRRWDHVTECRTPETSDALGCRAIERDLELPDPDHVFTIAARTVLSMPLRYVDPQRPRGRAYERSVRFGRSRIGQFVARHIARRTDPYLFRLTGGRVNMGPIINAPLVTTGAKSGKPRQVQLTYFHDGRDVILLASNYGGTKHPQWYHNLKANPDCEFGMEPFTASEVTDPDEDARLFGLAEKVYAGYDDYRDKTAPAGRQIPIFRLRPR